MTTDYLKPDTFTGNHVSVSGWGGGRGTQEEAQWLSLCRVRLHQTTGPHPKDPGHPTCLLYAKLNSNSALDREVLVWI